MAVEGSGMSSISLSLISWNPRILDPSKPMPSAKRLSSRTRTGELKCCQVPGTSVNLKSTIRTPFSWANRITSSGVIVMRRSLFVSCTNYFAVTFNSSDILDILPIHSHCKGAHGLGIEEKHQLCDQYFVHNALRLSGNLPGQ